MNTIAFSGQIAESVLLIVFGAALGLFAAISFILNYHWRTYGFDRGKIRTMKIIYYMGGGFFLLAMGLALFIYVP